MRACDRNACNGLHINPPSLCYFGSEPCSTALCSGWLFKVSSFRADIGAKVVILDSLGQAYSYQLPIGYFVLSRLSNLSKTLEKFLKPI